MSVRQRAVGAIVELADLDELGEYILDTATDDHEKGAAGYWVAAPVYGTRSNANTEPTRVVALDWDDSDVAPDQHPGLRSLAWFAHTTDSHTPDNPRWRVWLVLDREYTVDEVGRAQCPWEGVYLRAASQPAFVPTRADELEWVSSAAGRPLSLLEWGAAPAELTRVNAPAALVDPHPKQPTLASTHALVARWLGRPEGTNRLAGAVGATLASWGWDDAAVAGWLRTHLSADPKLSKHIDDAVRAARTRRSGVGAVPGLPTLEAELGVPFEAEPAAGGAAAWSGEELWDALAAPSSDGALPEVDQNGWVTAAAVVAWQPPPVAWLVEGLALAPGAPVLLSGYGGSGKTTLAQHLAVCVAAPPRGGLAAPESLFQEGVARLVARPPGGASAWQPEASAHVSVLSGRRVFGVLDAVHGAVTHIDYEQGVELTARRYLDLGLTAESALRFRAPPIPTPGLGAEPAARQWLAEACVGQALVLVDSFVAGLGAALEDENAAAVREPLDFLTRVSVETGAVILVIHHSRKTQRGGDARQTARGSSAITDAVSVHLNYERDDDGAVLKVVKLRRSPPAGLLAGLLSGEGVRVTRELTLGGHRGNGAVDPDELDDAAGGQPTTPLAVVESWGTRRNVYRSTSAVCRALGVATSGPDFTAVKLELQQLAAEGRIEQRDNGQHPTWWTLNG
jgi:hypothetical protein